ncbi:MAG: hypothetical protein [Caudoviricetes sp.]|nr:MAG: hypothetical protein [Caudoviricetes sp.]
MWIYNDKEIGDDDIEGYASFVYIITNLETGKKYIGKKIFKSIRRQKVKGKTRKKKVEKESDWRKYFGSNLGLLKDLEELGPDRFRREIVKLCKTRGTASYWEAKYQMQHEVLEKPDEYYNEWIFVKVHRSHLKLDNK